MKKSPRRTEKCVYVLSDIDGYKYKLVMQSEVHLLSARKIKCYLAQATGVDAAYQKLSFNGRELAENWNGGDIGLFDGAVLRLQYALGSQSPPSSSLVALGRDSNGNTAAHKPERTLADPHTQSGVATYGMYSSAKGLRGKAVTPARSSWKHHATSFALQEQKEVKNLDNHHDTCFINLTASHGPGGGSRSSQQPPSSNSWATVSNEREALSSYAGDCSSERSSVIAKALESISTGDIVGGGTVTQYTSAEGFTDGDIRTCQCDPTSPSAAFAEVQYPPSARQSEAQSCVSTVEDMPHRQESGLAQRHGSLDALGLECPPGTISATSGERLSDEVKGMTGVFRRHPTMAVPDPRVSTLEAENNALQRENKMLQQKLLEAERRVSQAASDSHLWKETGAMNKGETEFLEAEAMWRHKEEELVKELDLLREERRRAQKELELFKKEQQQLVNLLKVRVESQRNELHEKEEVIRQLQFTLAELQSKQDPRDVSVAREKSLDELAQASLERVALVMDIPRIELDAHSTCVIDIGDDLSILFTLDQVTERLFMYATLLNEIPAAMVVRLRLYETLLDGALLGKDTAGGAVGFNKESDLVLLSLSIDVRHSDASALAVCVRPFIDSVKYWVRVVRGLVANE